MAQGSTPPKTDALVEAESSPAGKRDEDNTVGPAAGEKVTQSQPTFVVQKEGRQGSMLSLSNSFVLETPTSPNGLKSLDPVGLQHIRPTSKSPFDKVDSSTGGPSHQQAKENG